jgi:hypothetical protein
LVAKQDDKEQKGEGHQAAAITTAAAPAALPLKIGIAEFCQGKLPIRLGKI